MTSTLSGLETTFGLDILNSISVNQSYVFSPISLLFTLAILGPIEFNSSTVSQTYSKYGLKDPDVYKYLKKDMDGIVVRGDSGMKEHKVSPVNESRILFNQAWEARFPHHQIRSGNFYPTSSTSKKVIYFKDENRFLYSEDEVFKTVSIPFDSRNLHFVVFLPKQEFGLVQALKNLTKSRFEKLLSDFTPEPVNLSIPKFEIIQLLINSKQLGLQPPIKTMMSYKLQPRAAKIVSGRPRVMSSAAMQMIHRPENRDLIFFKADQPFVFCVLRRDRPVYFGVYS